MVAQAKFNDINFKAEKATILGNNTSLPEVEINETPKCSMIKTTPLKEKVLNNVVYKHRLGIVVML